jgi:hypothetical protein
MKNPLLPLAMFTNLGSPFDRFFMQGASRKAGEFRHSSPPTGEEAEIPDPPQSPGHQVTTKARQKHRDREGSLLLAPFGPVVLPFETHRLRFFVDLQDPVITDRDPAGVAGQIAHHRPGIAQGGTAENIPPRTRQARRCSSEVNPSGQTISFSPSTSSIFFKMIPRKIFDIALTAKR